jgi:hypothetical protein
MLDPSSDLAAQLDAAHDPHVLESLLESVRSDFEAET